MGILKKAVNEMAFLKAGIFGFAGSGKTYSASMLAIAIAHKLGNKKPVAFFDTETGSDFLIPRFQAEGIDLMSVKSRALSDLLAAAKEAEATCSIMIVDSITHVWNDVQRAKLDAVNAARKKKGYSPLFTLQFQHQADVKRVWQQWSDFFVDSKLHIIVCGRAGYQWGHEENEETGQDELKREGTKMKAESEFAFEPSLLVEMIRESKGDTAGDGWRHKAVVLKDRTDLINGKSFIFEKPRATYKKGDFENVFKPFQPVINALNIGGEHIGTGNRENSEKIFPSAEGESKGLERAKRVEIVLGDIQETIVMMYPGQDAASKQIKARLLDSVFGVRGWPAVESLSLEALEKGARVLRSLEESFRTQAPESQEEVFSRVKAFSEQGVQ